MREIYSLVTGWFEQGLITEKMWEDFVKTIYH